MAKSTPSEKGANAHHARSPRIMRCDWQGCHSKYQDERYGFQMRVHNPRKENKWACTVCGSLKG